MNHPLRNAVERLLRDIDGESPTPAAPVDTEAVAAEQARREQARTEVEQARAKAAAE